MTPPPAFEPSPAVELRQCRVVLGNSGSSAVELRLEELLLAPGEHLALTGPSGCGKSTLLNVVAGLVRPASGMVRVFGKELAPLTPAQADDFRARHMAFVFQSYHLLEPFSALENVLLGLRFCRQNTSGNPRKTALEALERVGLGHRAASLPARLSMGERQRVALARALVTRPRLILADEPTAALDPETGDDVAKLMLVTASELEAALMLVTHDESLAGRFPRRFDCRGLIPRTGGGRS
jgi:predicted ABC-type transport system involved in lysophospholipase L1 biosynthesis ATPase subunit